MRGARKNNSSNVRFSNHEVVVLAAYLAGAKTNYADTEDIAVKADGIAPGRFAWRKYKQQINIDTVRKRLWDATKTEKGAYLVGSERDGWLLTQRGLKFCKKNIASIKANAPSATRNSKREQSWITKERIRLLAEPAYQKFSAGKLNQISPTEAERFFRVDDYVVGDARKRKIQRSLEVFQSDPALNKAIPKIAAIVREK